MHLLIMFWLTSQLRVLLIDENGKTDVVAGVSISIGNFIDLAEKALIMAASGEGAESTVQTKQVARCC